MASVPNSARSALHGRDRGWRSWLKCHWRTILFLVLTTWLCGAVTVALVRGLGSAQRSGAAEQVGAQYQQYLGTGWLPLEVDRLTPASSSAPTEWLAVNDSNGTLSTIRPSASWDRLQLRLAPVGCRNGLPLTITLRQGSTHLGVLRPSAGWSWYEVPLVHPGRTVTLHYSCVVTELESGLGLRRPISFAVLLSGIAGDR